MRSPPSWPFGVGRFSWLERAPCSVIGPARPASASGTLTQPSTRCSFKNLGPKARTRPRDIPAPAFPAPTTTTRSALKLFVPKFTADPRTRIPRSTRRSERTAWSPAFQMASRSFNKALPVT